MEPENSFFSLFVPIVQKGRVGKDICKKLAMD